MTNKLGPAEEAAVRTALAQISVAMDAIQNARTMDARARQRIALIYGDAKPAYNESPNCENAPLHGWHWGKCIFCGADENPIY